jgi:hypothetical protein
LKTLGKYVDLMGYMVDYELLANGQFVEWKQAWDGLRKFAL